MIHPLPRLLKGFSGLRRKLQTKSRFRLFCNIAIFVLILTVVSFGFNFAHAQTADLALNSGSWLLDLVIQGLMYITKLFISVAVFALKFFIQIAQYNNYMDAPPVVLGWIMVRDVANMFFVVALLVIAFSTILNLDNYEWQKTFAKLVIAAIFINFSKMILQLIIDIAHVFTITFLNAVSATAAGNLTKMFKLDQLLKLLPEPGAGTGSLRFDLFLGVVTTVVMSGMTMMLIGAYTLIMVMRMVVLWMLMILSPIAFICQVLPQTKSYADEFWQEFNHHVLVAPIMVFFLWLAFATLGNGDISTTILGSGNEASGEAIKAAEAMKLNVTNPSISISAGATWENLGSFIIALGFLYLGIERVQKLGVQGGGFVSKATDFGKKLGYLFSGYALGKWGAGKVKQGAIAGGKYVGMKVPIVGGRAWLKRGNRIAQFWHKNVQDKRDNLAVGLEEKSNKLAKAEMIKADQMRILEKKKREGTFAKGESYESEKARIDAEYVESTSKKEVGTATGRFFQRLGAKIVQTDMRSAKEVEDERAITKMEVENREARLSQSGTERGLRKQEATGRKTLEEDKAKSKGLEKLSDAVTRQIKLDRESLKITIEAREKSEKNIKDLEAIPNRTGEQDTQLTEERDRVVALMKEQKEIEKWSAGYTAIASKVPAETAVAARRRAEAEARLRQITEDKKGSVAFRKGVVESEVATGLEMAADAKKQEHRAAFLDASRKVEDLQRKVGDNRSERENLEAKRANGLPLNMAEAKKLTELKQDETDLKEAQAAQAYFENLAKREEEYEKASGSLQEGTSKAKTERGVKGGAGLEVADEENVIKAFDRINLEAAIAERGSEITRLEGLQSSSQLSEEGRSDLEKLKAEQASDAERLKKMPEVEVSDDDVKAVDRKKGAEAMGSLVKMQDDYGTLVKAVTDLENAIAGLDTQITQNTGALAAAQNELVVKNRALGKFAKDNGLEDEIIRATGRGSVSDALADEASVEKMRALFEKNVNEEVREEDKAKNRNGLTLLNERASAAAKVAGMAKKGGELEKQKTEKTAQLEEAKKKLPPKVDTATSEIIQEQIAVLNEIKKILAAPDSKQEGLFNALKNKLTENKGQATAFENLYGSKHAQMSIDQLKEKREAKQLDEIIGLLGRASKLNTSDLDSANKTNEKGEYTEIVNLIVESGKGAQPAIDRVRNELLGKVMKAHPSVAAAYATAKKGQQDNYSKAISSVLRDRMNKLVLADQGLVGLPNTEILSAIEDLSKKYKGVERYSLLAAAAEKSKIVGDKRAADKSGTKVYSKTEQFVDGLESTALLSQLHDTAYMDDDVDNTKSALRAQADNLGVDPEFYKAYRASRNARSDRGGTAVNMNVKLDDIQRAPTQIDALKSVTDRVVTQMGVDVDTLVTQLGNNQHDDTLRAIRSLVDDQKFKDEIGKLGLSHDPVQILSLLKALPGKLDLINKLKQT